MNRVFCLDFDTYSQATSRSAWADFKVSWAFRKSSLFLLQSCENTLKKNKNFFVLRVRKENALSI